MLLTEAFNDGPASYNTTSIGIELIDANLDIDNQIACERGETTTINCGAAADEAYFLQDTRDWFGVHIGAADQERLDRRGDCPASLHQRYLRSLTPFLPATVFLGPLRVRALVLVR